MECSICFSQSVDKVSMTCSSQHSFCFKCLLQNIEANNKLKSCPNCRGGDKFIMLTPNPTTSGTPITSGTNGFYSLNYFKKSLPIMQKILKDNITINTCLISEIILICYIKNKKQLEIAHKLLSLEESIDSIVSIIRWDERKNLEDIGVEIFNGLATNGLEFLGIPIHLNSERVATEQRERRTPQRSRNDDHNGARVIIGNGQHFPFPPQSGGLD